MAMVECRYCGKQISEKAKICPACGKNLKVAFITCPECGQEMPKKAKACQNCGCPNKAMKVKRRKTTLKILLSIILLVAVAVGTLIVIRYITDKKNEEIYAEAEQLLKEGDYEKSEEKYQSISGYKDATEKRKLLRAYNQGIQYYNENNYKDAFELFEAVGDFADSQKYEKQMIWESIILDCLSSAREAFYNPETWTVNNIFVYTKRGIAIGEQLYQLSGENPVVVMEGTIKAKDGTMKNMRFYCFYFEGKYQYVDGVTSYNEFFTDIPITYSSTFRAIDIAYYKHVYDISEKMNKLYEENEYKTIELTDKIIERVLNGMDESMQIKVE